MRRRTALTGAAVALAAAGAAATAGGGSGTRSGVALWAEGGCGSCHTLAAAGASASRGPDLDRLQPSVVAVAAQIANGGRGMPSFANRFSAPEIETLAVYVSSVAGTRPAVPVKVVPLTPPTIGLLPLTTASTKQLQKELARLGFFHGPETGYYGPQTTAAVRLFQTSAGIAADGQWGPASDRALVRRYAAAR